MISVDIGSQNIKVQHNAKRPLMLPCVVAQTDELLIGKEALKELATRHSSSVQHLSAGLQNKKKIKLCHSRGESEGSLELLLAMLLQKATEGKSSNDSVILTVPSAMTSMELKRIRTAAMGSDMNKIIIIPCVLAIAHYYQTKILREPLTTPQYCLVLDAGCRFTSAAVVKLQTGCAAELVSCKAIRIGGHDLDALFLKSIEMPAIDCHPVLVQNAIEKAKKELSSLTESTVVIKSFSTKVTREGFLKSIEPFLTKVTDVITGVCNAVVDKSKLTSVVISGGTGRISAVRDIAIRAGDHNLNIETNTVDYDYCSTQGGIQWMNSFGEYVLFFFCTDEVGEETIQIKSRYLLCHVIYFPVRQ